jgi:uncharacterized protein (DUF2252 family)
MPSHDIARRVLRYNAGRDPARLDLKFRGMRSRPFTFFRATAHLFYQFDDLLGPVAGAPAVWSAGDVHLENFGCFKADNRLAYFDLNDFDEAALGPLTWDLVRLLASAMLGAGGPASTRSDRKDIAREILARYTETLAGGKARWLERATAEGPIRRLLRQARRRTRRALLAERTRPSGRSRKFRIRPGRQLAASPAERRAVGTLLARMARQQPDPGFFRVRDVVRRVAGMASLGVTRYAVLVEGRGSPNNNYLLDLKAALPSVLAAASPYRQPRWTTEAERVVTVQSWVQAVPPALLTPLRLRGEPLVLRELQPTADRLRTTDWRSSGVELSHLARAVGWATAWGHLRAAGRHGADGIDRLIGFGRGRHWQVPVLRSAVEAARRTETEWEEFCRSHDAGELDPRN